MTTASVPVDPLNPGQVFACLGLAELSEQLLGPTFAGFDWSAPEETRFVMQVAADADPVVAGLEFLAAAEVHSLSPDDGLSTEKWDVPVQLMGAGEPFPIARPSSPATLPAVLMATGKSVVVCSWGEGRAREVLGSGRDNAKFWAGAGGYPGVALIRDALEVARPLPAETRFAPFALGARQSSSLRFDWRRDYIPIDIGFSLNEHSRMDPQGYPLVEVLAVLGLAHARPQRIRKLEYRYAIAGRSDTRASDGAALLPMPLLRLMLGAVATPFPTRTFSMHLDWPSQENKDRCITTVHEETAS